VHSQLTVLQEGARLIKHAQARKATRAATIHTSSDSCMTLYSRTDKEHWQFAVLPEAGAKGKLEGRSETRNWMRIKVRQHRVGQTADT
jgi:hypothetical protein